MTRWTTCRAPTRSDVPVPATPVISPRFCSAIYLAILSVCLVSVDAVAQGEADAHRQGRELIERYMSETETPGLSVAVQVADSLVWAEGFGIANVEHKVPVHLNTRFRVGSISKTLTSVAAGLLYEQGLLDLDVPIQTYVPSFPDKGAPITTRQLGGHLSGVPNYEGEDFVNLIHYESVLASLDKFKNRPLVSPPGEQFHYSSFGFTLISAVVEAASGEPFLDYMDAAVFGPLGMESTTADRYEMVIPHRTGFYEITDIGVQTAIFTDNSDVWAGGGFLSTPSDLVSFGSGLLRGDLVRPETLELLFRSMTTRDGEVTDYGFGWMIEDVDGYRMVGHGGSHFGAKAHLLLFPEAQVVVAVTANSRHRSFHQMAKTLASFYLP